MKRGAGERVYQHWVGHLSCTLLSQVGSFALHHVPQAYQEWFMSTEPGVAIKPKIYVMIKARLLRPGRYCIVRCLLCMHRPRFGLQHPRWSTELHQYRARSEQALITPGYCPKTKIKILLLLNLMILECCDTLLCINKIYIVNSWNQFIKY